MWSAWVCLLLLAPLGVLGRVAPGWQILPGGELAVIRGPKEVTREVDPFNDITFYLYTRSNPEVPVQIWVGDLNGSPYDPSKPTKFMIHGYNSNHLNGWIIQFKDGTLFKEFSGNEYCKYVQQCAQKTSRVSMDEQWGDGRFSPHTAVHSFLRTEDCNAVGVDWSGPASGLLYNQARNNVNITGEYVGALYDFLAQQGAHPATMHCMGHSLGSHVCGFSGKTVTSGTLGRITGLDPALPLFSLEKPDERLADTDAAFVDVIHTCGGLLGFQSPIGHADFFPNAGTMIQPGCGVDPSGGCSHERCHEFFAESIESPNFVSHSCGSWQDFQAGLCASNPTALMGNSADPGTRGTFYLATASESPYALG